MFVQTRASQLKSNPKETCEIVVFKTGKASIKKSAANDTQPELKVKESNNKDQLDLKKLRYEVIKFGSSGFDETKKEESRVALAVAMGAKPLKKKNRNYKEILAEKRDTKAKGVQKKTKNSFKKNRKEKIGGLLKTYGKVRPGE